MMGLRNSSRGLPRLRQPEYTGRNRCLPCTLVNVAIAVGVSLGVALWSRPAAVALAVVALVVIYLRGYLIPGTPALTKRYLPAWLLACFGKAPPAAFDGEADPGAVLSTAGLLRPTSDGTDIRLDPSFAARWAARTQALLASDPERERVAFAAFLDLPVDDLLVAEGETGVSAHLDGRFLGSWPSRTAFAADIAGSELLAPLLDGWEAIPSSQRTDVTSTLRLFTESCPRCGGTVDLGEERRESCCSSHDVVTADCVDCGARLIELPLSTAMREAMDDEPS